MRHLKIVKTIETKRMVAGQGWCRRKQELLCNGYRVSVLEDEKRYRDGW
jgi:hypothetical protein